jgi:NOL1/NOP2/fmu family ribosome biogenesis protein
MAGRGIRLQESPEGGVIVLVGTQKFAGVGEVTDPEVKAILQDAISAWEKKYTPG